jgi:ribose transport system permease protein
VGALVPNFLTLRNLLNVVRQSSIISLVAYGMTMVIIVKGIDLAVGGMMSCCAMISGLLMLQHWPVVLAVGAGLLVGIIMGAFNGMMVQKLEVPAFITTLVVGQVAGGIALVLNNGRSIGGFPAGYVFIGNGSFLGIPISNYITLVFVIFCTILMARTRIGIYIYALGGNDMVVKQQGISSAKINYFVFAFSGFCAAVAGVLLSAQLDTVHPTQGSNYQLDAVAACVIGGVNMVGGEGKIYMSLAGALIIGFLRNALNLLGMHPFYQNIIVGVIIILIVAVSINGRQREIERGRVF